MVKQHPSLVVNHKGDFSLLPVPLKLQTSQDFKLLEK